MRRILCLVLYCGLAIAIAGCAGGGWGTSPLPYNASGEVIDGEGNGVSGVTILFSDGYGIAMTGPEGRWTKSYLQGTVTVTPQGEGWIFTPSQGTMSPSSEGLTIVAIPETGVIVTPIASDHEVEANEDSSIVIDVLSEISEAGDGEIVIVDITQPSNGAANLLPDQQIEYVPDEDFFGDDSFTYTVSNGQGETATGTVNLTIHPVEDDPVAVDDYFVVSASPEGGTISYLMGLLSNDVDPDGDTLEVVAVGDPVHGQVLQFWPEGNVEYAPDVGFEGVDSFVYTVSDGTGRFSTAVARVQVYIGE